MSKEFLIDKIDQNNIEKLLKNHPALCHICAKMGECELQSSYRKLDRTVTKKIEWEESFLDETIISLGRNIVFDKKFCINCLRCVSFLTEFSKTSEFSMEKNEEGKDLLQVKPLKNDYAKNLIDLCPTAALVEEVATCSYPLRNLRSFESICIGCTTGCKIYLDLDKLGPIRVRPAEDAEVNVRWMCDFGRTIIDHYKPVHRLKEIVQNINGTFVPTDYKLIIEKIKKKNIKLILSLDLLNEEYEKIFTLASNYAVTISFYKQPFSGPDFDGILRRGNSNSNQFGLEHIWKRFRDNNFILPEEQFFETLSDDDVVVMVLPEIITDFNYLFDYVGRLGRADFKIAFTVGDEKHVLKEFNYLFPHRPFFERGGTIFNFEGVIRKIRAITMPNKSFNQETSDISAMSLITFLQLILNVKKR